MGKWDKAGAAYEKALRYDSQLVAASYNLARALIETGSYARARDVLEGLLEEDPDNVRLISLKAYSFHLSGDDESALEVYERAAELNPHDAATLKNVSLLQERIGRDLQAVAILRELYTVDPSDDAVLRRLALLEARSGEKEAAETLLSAYLSRKPEDAQVIRVRARLREEGELFALALEDWAALVKADDSDADAWFRLARIRLVVAGDSAGGLEALKRALDAKFSDKDLAKALVAALPEAEREKPSGMLAAAGLLE